MRVVPSPPLAAWMRAASASQPASAASSSAAVKVVSTVTAPQRSNSASSASLSIAVELQAPRSTPLPRLVVAQQATTMAHNALAGPAAAVGEFPLMMIGAA